MELLTSFEGRIGRRSWWVGLLIMVVIALVLGLLLGSIFGGGFFGRLIGGLIGLGLLYPWAAIVSKRLHDHGEEPMPKLAIFLAPGAIQSVMHILGIDSRETVANIGGVTMVLEQPTILGYLVGVISLIIGIYAIYLLGIKRGTVGDNTYGPDPVS